ncbi:MAG: arsenite efflux transporter metallochaperone ArsD [Dysgonomonas sp.]|nr:arsenite efflux transporter metallochaperone ArsD [Dysgonomonas sp.]
MLDLKLDTRKEVKIYDPALCCPTGLCGVNIDPELMRIAVVIETLKKKGITIERFNLRDHPQVYVDNKKINDCLMKESAEVLPITTLDGEIVLTKQYPSNAQIAEWMNVKEEELTVKK